MSQIRLEMCAYFWSLMPFTVSGMIRSSLHWFCDRRDPKANQHEYPWIFHSIVLLELEKSVPV
eukprot:6340903-Amphidinium_carterae.3